MSNTIHFFAIIPGRFNSLESSSPRFSHRIITFSQEPAHLLLNPSLSHLCEQQLFTRLLPQPHHPRRIIASVQASTKSHIPMRNQSESSFHTARSYFSLRSGRFISFSAAELSKPSSTRATFGTSAASRESSTERNDHSNRRRGACQLLKALKAIVIVVILFSEWKTRSRGQRGAQSNSPPHADAKSSYTAPPKETDEANSKPPSTPDSHSNNSSSTRAYETNERKQHSFFRRFCRLRRAEHHRNRTRATDDIETEPSPNTDNRGMLRHRLNRFREKLRFRH